MSGRANSDGTRDEPDRTDSGPAECLSASRFVGLLQGEVAESNREAIREHLDVCSTCRLVMAEAARAVIDRQPANERSLRTLAIGERVADRYEIRAFVAKGGMGEVYEAFDHALHEVVALKTLLVTAIDRTDAAERLLAEVRIARRITHPLVCRILEFGIHRRDDLPGEAVPFLTMPLLLGETLAQRLDRCGRLTADQARRVLRDVAEGLTAVHAAGVVHRDLKSENVFLVRGEDGGERAIVMDFGLAGAVGGLSGGRSRRACLKSGIHSGPHCPHCETASSIGGHKMIVGTPAYMAPEQCAGRAATRASDIYAFGVVAYETLTGELPPAATLPTAAGRYGAPIPSSVMSGLSAWDALLRRCLYRDPARRFADMLGIVAALDSLDLARRKWSTRRLLSIPLGAALVLALAAAYAARPKARTTTIRSVPGQPATVGSAVPLQPVPPLRHSDTLHPARSASPLGSSPSALRRSAVEARGRAGRQTKTADVHTVPREQIPMTDSRPDGLDGPSFELPSAARPSHPDDLIDPF